MYEMDPDALGRKLSLTHLSEDECESILKVIQRDFDIRQHEKQRLTNVEEEITEEDEKSNILAKKREFNENCCMRCFSRFYFLFKTKVQCFSCNFFVCKNCSSYDATEKNFICNVCHKQRELRQQSCNWFYNNVRDRFKRFGSAKVVRSLYKRRTESEESDFALSDSAVFSSHSGRRPRREFQERFEMNLDDGIEVAKSKTTDDLGSVSETGEALQNHINNNNNKSRLQFEDVRDMESKQFSQRLDAVVQDMNLTLEHSTSAQQVSTRAEREHLLDTHRLQLCSAVSRFSQSLHIALDSQDVSSTIIAPTRSTRNQLVKETIAKAVEAFVAHPISVKDEDITSEYGSESGTEPNTPQSPRTLEDIFTNMIVSKVLDDFQNKENERLISEEQMLVENLSKLETQATPMQISNGWSSSISDQDAAEIQAMTAQENAASQLGLGHEAGDQLLDQSDAADLSKSVTGKTTADLMGSQLNGEMSADQSFNQSMTSTLSDTSREAEVQAVIEPQLSSQTVQTTEAFQGREEQTDSKFVGVWAQDLDESDISSIHEETLHENEKKLPELPDGSAKDESEFDEAKHALSEQTEVELSTQVELLTPEVNAEVREFREQVRLEVIPDQDSSDAEGDGMESMEFAQKHSVPLPSFGYDETKDVDLDDISRISDEEDDDEEEDEDNDEFSRVHPKGRNWLFGGLFKGRGVVTPYDNVGSKKVGKGAEGPTLMFLPQTIDPNSSLPRVGEHNPADLSDLSDATGSEDDQSDEDTEEEGAEDDGEEVGGHFDDEGRFVVGKKTRRKSKRKAVQRSDSGVQTEEGQLTVKEVEEREDKKEQKEEEVVVDPYTLKLAKLLERPESPAGEDVDPKFKVKPEVEVKVSEGDKAKFTVEVEGTRPIDVFWYRQEVDALLDLSDQSQYELAVAKGDSCYSCTLPSVAKDDQGRYMVLAVNEVGRCSREMVLLVTDYDGETSAPEFIRPLQDVQINEGHKVKLRAKVKGYPQPRVSWLKDGKLLQKSDGYLWEKLGNRDYVLTIHSVTLDDDAEFMLIAKNSSGEARCAANIVVDVKDDSLTPSPPSTPNLAPLPTYTPAVIENTSTVTTSLSSPDTAGLYPDTDQLLRVVNTYRNTHTDSKRIAEDMVASAGRPSAPSDTVVEEIQKSANESLQTLNTMDEQPLITPGRYSFRSHQKQTPPSSESSLSSFFETETRPAFDNSTEEVELDLTYEEFECCLGAGVLTWQQFRYGRLTRHEMAKVQEFLASLSAAERRQIAGTEATVEDENSEATSINCGPKRVDSKRYKRDYVIVRNSPQVQRRKWMIREPSAEGTEVVKSTPAGEREDPLSPLLLSDEQWSPSYPTADAVSPSLRYEAQPLTKQQLSPYNESCSPPLKEISQPNRFFPESVQVERNVLSAHVEPEPQAAPVKPPRHSTTKTTPVEDRSRQKTYEKRDSEDYGIETDRKPPVVAEFKGFFDQRYAAEPREVKSQDARSTKRGSQQYVEVEKVKTPDEDRDVRTMIVQSKVIKVESRKPLQSSAKQAEKSAESSQSKVEVTQTQEVAEEAEREDFEAEFNQEPAVPDAHGEWQDGARTLPSVKDLMAKFSHNKKDAETDPENKRDGVSGLPVASSSYQKSPNRSAKTMSELEEIMSPPAKQAYIHYTFDDSDDGLSPRGAKQFVQYSSGSSREYAVQSEDNGNFSQSQRSFQSEDNGNFSQSQRSFQSFALSDAGLQDDQEQDSSDEGSDQSLDQETDQWEERFQTGEQYGVTRSEELDRATSKHEQLSHSRVEKPQQVKADASWSDRKKDKPSSPSPGKSSVILARAAFWDSRVKAQENPEMSVVEEFPDIDKTTVDSLQ